MNACRSSRHQLQRLSSVVFVAICLVSAVASAQVPSICVQSSGESWGPQSGPMPQNPVDSPRFELTPEQRLAVLEYQKSLSTTEQLKTFLNTPLAPANQTPSKVSSLPAQPKLNRYTHPSATAQSAVTQLPAPPRLTHAPNAQLHQSSVSPNTVGLPNAPVYGAMPAPHSVSPRGFAPHSVSNSRNMRLVAQGEDDLLAPLSPQPQANNASDGDDLLAPPKSDDLLAPMPPQGMNSLSPAGDDPLNSLGPDASREQERNQRRESAPPATQAAIDPHAEVFANEKYPSALACGKCHQKIYDEWRVSSHAYSAVSPMFNRFEQAVAELLRGTSGTFCLRCHAPVATQSCLPREAPIFSGPVVYREGITCIACHRVVERYGRVNGERRIETGSLYDPVVGSLGGNGIATAIANADQYKVKTDPNDKRPYQGIHQGAIQFEQLSDSSFCAGCHQVLVQPGIALEVVYQQYRSGPACRKGVSCQDCHMGMEPGKAKGYLTAPAAEVSGKVYDPNRKHSNHIFHGPAIPLAHPGIFPHNEKSLRWTAEQWLQFDHREGWGTEPFETALARGEFQAYFPPAWTSPQERRDARKVVTENQQLIGVKRSSAIKVLENGSRIDGPFFDNRPARGEDLKVRYVVSNTSEGHNMPSGSLGAQPQLWLNAVLIGPDGTHLWESGHLDSNGDLRDWHSLDVRANRVPRDTQLVNFQTKFLINNVKGTDREMYLPVPVDLDPLPIFRPGAVPYTVLNHPPFIRMEAHSIPPLDSRTAHYSIPGNLLCKPGKYRLSVRMRSRVEPPYFMIFCKGTPDMLKSLNENILDVHPYSVEFEIP